MNLKDIEAIRELAEQFERDACAWERSVDPEDQALAVAYENAAYRLRRLLLDRMT